MTHFVTLTFWESMNAIRAFAGEDPAVAEHYRKDAGYLLEFEPMVVHYEVAGAA